MQDIANELYR